MNAKSLDDRVRLVKTPAAAWVEFADGTRRPMSEVLGAEDQAARERLGVIHPRLRARLNEVQSDAVVPVVVKYARQTTDAATNDELTTVEEALVTAGMTTTGRGRIAPIVFALGIRDSIEQIDRNRRIEGIYLDEPVDVASLADETYAPPYTEADTYLWPLGIKGEGQTIGYIEAAPSGFQAYGEHVHFQNGVQHTRSAVSCSYNFECEVLCSGTQGCACRSNRCVQKHATWVGSVIAQVAPDATLVLANPSGLTPLSFSGIEDAHADLHELGITSVNQSFNAQDGGVQGIIENDLARKNVLVTQAAGNSAGEAGAISQSCRFNDSALCVGAHGYQLQSACFSNFENPTGNPDKNGHDREEPDVLAFGGDGAPLATCNGVPSQSVMVAGTDTKYGVAFVFGTSSAAPAAAAGAALVRQYCERMGHTIGALGLRAVLMGGALRNSQDFRYSTPSGTAPGSASDWRDGGGVMSLGASLAPCDPGGSEGWAGFGEEAVDLASGQDSPEVDPEYETPKDPPEQPLAQDVPLGSNDGRKTRVLYDLGSLTRDHRVRFVVSWNACRSLPSTPTYRAVPDFDLFLFNRTKKHVYFASQSFDDVNEGFDVDLGAYPGNDDGDEFEILLGWLPNGSFGECPDNDGKEPIAWAGWVWVP